MLVAGVCNIRNDFGGDSDKFDRYQRRQPLPHQQLSSESLSTLCLT